MSALSDPDQAETPSLRRRLSIATYLGVGLGGLVAAALGLLLWVTLSAVFKNTTELLNDKSRIFLGSLTAQTTQFLDATLAPTDVVAQEISNGGIDPRDDEQLMPLLRTLLAATPQITAMAFFDIDGTVVSSFRHGNEVLANRQPWPDREDIQRAVQQVKDEGPIIWGEPVFDQGIGTFVNLRRAVFEEGVFRGMMTAVIDVESLSTFLVSIKTEIGQNAFILYDNDYVLAHRRLIRPFPGLGEDRPLPEVNELGDPILAGIWKEGWEDLRLVAGSGHFYDRHGDDYIFLYESLADYADAPWLVGSYFPEDTIATQFQRMTTAGVISLCIVVLTVGAIWLLGRLLRQPIADLAEAASRVRDLDFERVPPIKPSRFAELDNAGSTFNAMVAALRIFSRYVPKSLVERLVAAGDVDAIRSEVKPVTVMMTDIAGFTARAETMSAADTAGFINAHLATVTGCIEGEGGIVDKFMGDGVMALWGAIDPEPDQAVRAVSAAIALREQLTEDNQGSAEPLRIRIGIHSGDVVAGNIGTATRMNYTVVGDTVNMAQRLEVLGKTLLPKDDVAIVISAETAERLNGKFTTRPLGVHELRGRAGKSDVFTVSRRQPP